MNQTLHFKIMGMHCVSCATHLEAAIASLKGVQKVQVNFVNNKTIIETDSPSPALNQNILNAIKEQGYEGELLKNTLLPYEPSHQTSYRSSTINLGIAIVFTLPLVTHMIGFHISPTLQLFCATIVQFWAGRRFYKASWFALKRLHGDMDLLVTMGTSAAYFYSLTAVILHKNDLYFEVGAVVITLVLLGRFLEDRATRSANTAVRSLMQLAPPTALVERDGEYKEIPTQEIKKGDHIMVKSWQHIPVDGIISDGVSEVDESMITGESVPVFKGLGDKVIGGTTNTFGILYLIVTAIDHESTLFRMIRLVEEAQASHSPIQKLVDQISAIFVPIVLIISLVTFGVWYVIGPTFQQAMLVSISVLVVACPCALGLATPTAIVVAMGTAAKKGILIKDLTSLEALRKIDQVVFDKTGTLTRGEFSLIFSDALAEIPEEQLLALAASLQKGSEHPLARAFLKAFKGQKFLNVKNFRSLPGRGVTGTIRGRVYYLGSQKLMTEQNIQVPLSFKAGQSTVYLAENGNLLALFRLADMPRKKALEALNTLRDLGLKTVMLTGDNKETAYAIGNKVGIDDIFAQLQPKDKINYVKAQEHHHLHIAMVGDGVNDGPALAAATVGFAMGSGSDVAMDAASITLMRPSLDLIPKTFILSNKTFRIIQENLLWAFLFNGIGIGLAAFGKLSPEVAGASMAASSLIVVLNSLRLKRG
ncbi:MAG: cadmium-translocating P-type ATPase [Alphaproteobacteria bacterium]|nr:cadmium-translocating P-type ATPase [Alphaproteobacteria bacterium]